MDNALLKKDNIIAGLKKKLEKYDDEKYNQYVDREVIIVEPSTAVNQIHDELLLYKQIYDNLVTHIKENRDSRVKYETVLNDLQNENANLRTQLKLQILNNNREKENNLLKERQELIRGHHKSPSNDIDIKSRKYSVTSSNKDTSDFNKIKNKLTLSDDKPKFDFQNNQNEEWLDILRHSGLTQDELERLSKNKSLSRIVETIEMLNRLLCDKNMQIRLLDQENQSLNQKNFSLNKENISLFQQSLELKKELQSYISKYSKKTEQDNTDASIVIICLNLDK
jgi:hypothetical protein